MKKFQLAHLYKHGRFYGYGIAVDGELLHNQISTSIKTNAQELPLINAVFNLDKETVNNPINIDLTKKHTNSDGEGESNPCG